MTRRSISIVAKVECRDEGRAEERPIAVTIGDQRLEIVDVLDRALFTGVEAGAPVRHRMWVELDDGQRCELTRVDPDGPWRVEVQN
jgi:hypothetical protein